MGLLGRIGTKRLFKKQSQQLRIIIFQTVIAQLGERQTEDLKVPGSIPSRGIRFYLRPCEFALSTWKEKTGCTAIKEVKNHSLSSRDSSVGRLLD